MDLFDILALVGGLSLFLFGMNQMGSALESRAGEGLKTLLSRLTTGRMAGFITGLAVTAVIQSSSATTVMVVGFVNSGLMTLRQAINVIMGANVGTTVTAWIFSLTGIEGDALWVQLLKPTSFTPILALIGIILQMAGKDSKKKDTGMILLGFAVLMFGMDAMSGAVEGLRDVPQFREILLMFNNPFLGVLAGALLTAIIQSSSASVGILQALASTGQVTYGAAIPIIMGQNIGTCITAMLSSVGTNRNARRAALVHLSFNVIGTTAWLIVFQIIKTLVEIPLLLSGIDQFGIAVVHSVFNILCTLLLLPLSGALEKLACRMIPEPAASAEDKLEELDERLMATPALAVERCRNVTLAMAELSAKALVEAMKELTDHDEERVEKIMKAEKAADHYEDILGTYLVKLSAMQLNDRDNVESAELLHLIGDFERISDHAVNVLESAKELRDKGIEFSPAGRWELERMTAAVTEIVELAMRAFMTNDMEAAVQVEPLEEVVDTLKEQLRARHILRLQRGECSIEAGFIWSDLLTNLERVADHCSNIAGCVLEMRHKRFNLHDYLHAVRKDSPEFAASYDTYARKYSLMQE
ncbi:MAG: Na/Pi cotransporter family protein [Ruminococcaceae bacterium]|nr:Na/Pi cotransporter family protein [Oscillospiraceae bacterium]